MEEKDMVFEIWVYRGIIGVLLIIVWWIVRLAFNRILDVIANINARFKNVDDKLEALNLLVTTSLSKCHLHEDKVNSLGSHVNELKMKSSDHGRRLTRVEFDVEVLKKHHKDE